LTVARGLHEPPQEKTADRADEMSDPVSEPTMPPNWITLGERIRVAAAVIGALELMEPDAEHAERQHAQARNALEQMARISNT
jgi:hypothetical protein